MKILCKSGQHNTSLGMYLILITETHVLTVIGTDWKLIKACSKLEFKEEFRADTHLLKVAWGISRKYFVENSEVRNSAQMKCLFYDIISIPYNPVHMEGHSISGKYFSHHTVACFQFLEYSSVQWLCQPLWENVCPKQARMHQKDGKQQEAVTLVLQRLTQRYWVAALAKGDSGNQQQHQALACWLVYCPWNYQSLKGHLSLWLFFLNMLCFLTGGET